MQHNRTKVRRRVLACARCRKRKLSCDGKVPACTRCVDAGVSCVGFDSSTQREAPRSIADYLEAYIASLEDPRSPTPLRRIGRPSEIFPSPAASHDSEGHSVKWGAENGTYADSLVNQVMEDVTPSFLGISKMRPILSCVVKGTQLPSRKGLVGSTDLDENHPRSIINPQPFTNCLNGIDYKTAVGLFNNYLDRIITQYPIYHRNDVTAAFNSIYYPVSNPGQETPRHRYIVSIIMAISLSTAARTNQRQANALAYTLVRQAMHFIPEVATNDISGLQAILLLTQYIFLNPSMADLWLLTGLISQAVIDLGLHQELPNDANISPYQRDMRRRLFWCAWEMEVGVCCIFLRPVNLPIQRIDVAFPLEVDDTAITQGGINLNGRLSKFTSRRICQFRMIEAEIYAVMRHGEPIPKECPSLQHWMQRCEASILEWQREIYASEAANQDPSFEARWKEMKLYSDIATPYIFVALYRPHPMNPMPTIDQQMTAFVNAVRVADGYWQQSNADYGRIKYVFHPCHHVFNCANIFLQVLQRCKQEIAERYQWQEIEDWMDHFSRCFSTIAERWTAATRCQEEYERLLAGIKEEYREFLAQRTSFVSHSHLAAPMTDTTGLYTYPVSDMDDINFWTVFNPTTATETIETFNASTYKVPYDWNEEFSLEFVPLQEAEQKFVTTAQI
ncbi:hypothetical protein K458DRAFT_446578 [Lentithecium fluviatile CBS 122367]|uniref:Zn(2)-C6 fungal-type domain-containing protein n=1 Tax=Lentithecium fluviatile CBS 122367 TaxID=1168545 RepID=A0A6G1IIS6_9PLEO|nr:hypothetical protein K458DRAFT_446578 [Lentithecium fluviatile CBS 122367]